MKVVQLGVRGAIARGQSKDEMIKTLAFPQYKDWRNSQNAPAHLGALHHLLTTGKPIYLDRE